MLHYDGSALWSRRNGAGLANEFRSADRCLAEAAIRPSLYCFPNKLTDIPVLEYAITANPTDPKAPYYLGCLFYDRKQFIKAKQLWETFAAIDPAFPTIWRNLSLVYYNKTKEQGKAKDVLEKAYTLDPTDARVFLELGLFTLEFCHRERAERVE